MNMPDFSRKEENIHAITHGIPTIISFIGLYILVEHTVSFQDNLMMFSFAFFGISLICVFLASTIYHWVDTMPLKKHLRVVDHLAIYLLIAGSYAPFALVNMRNEAGYKLITLVWGLAIFGVIFKILIRNQLQKYEKFDAGLYAAQGSTAFLFLEELSAAVPSEGMTFLAIGGACYIVGIYFYLGKHIPYHHAIWHLFVIGGAGFHYYTVLNYCTPQL